MIALIGYVGVGIAVWSSLRVFAKSRGIDTPSVGFSDAVPCLLWPLLVGAIVLGLMVGMANPVGFHLWRARFERYVQRLRDEEKHEDENGV
jgi:hypothetical protein